MSTPETGSDGAGTPEEPRLPPHRIEPARSNRSRCKQCRRKIEKGSLRLGVRIEGPFGEGFLWYHLRCGARRHLESVESAYETRAWEEGVEVPPIEELRGLAQQADEERRDRKTAPYVEVAPSGRSHCKLCGEKIAKGGPRLIMLRQVEFYGQTRAGPVNIHPACAATEMEREDSLVEAGDLAEKLRAHSAGVPPEVVERALAEIEGA